MTRFNSPSPGPMPLGLPDGGAEETNALAGAVALAGAAVAAVVGAVDGAALAATLAAAALAGAVDGFCDGAGVAPDDEQADTIKARVTTTPQMRPIRTSPPLPPALPVLNSPRRVPDYEGASTPGEHVFPQERAPRSTRS